MSTIFKHFSNSSHEIYGVIEGHLALPSSSRQQGEEEIKTVYRHVRALRLRNNHNTRLDFIGTRTDSSFPLKNLTTDENFIRDLYQELFKVSAVYLLQMISDYDLDADDQVRDLGPVSTENGDSAQADAQGDHVIDEEVLVEYRKGTITQADEEK
ncbi:hypothetical protein MMC11_002574 [Xylographa trunciseda]|nr:hypothetical protein [Xylographa trunciseda]